MCAKHYENPTMLSRVTVKNVGDVFLRHTVVVYLFQQANKTCNNNITTRYLGIYMVSAKVFKCSLHYAKCAFHRAVNAILVKLAVRPRKKFYYS